MKKVFCLVFGLVLFFQPVLIWAGYSATIKAEWEYSPPSGKTLSGFRLYKDGEMACVSKKPTENTMECLVDLDPGEITFTVTAYFTDGTETGHSAPFVLEFTGPRNIAPMLHLLLGDD